MTFYSVKIARPTSTSFTEGLYCIMWLNLLIWLKWFKCKIYRTPINLTDPTFFCLFFTPFCWNLWAFKNELHVETFIHIVGSYIFVLWQTLAIELSCCNVGPASWRVTQNYNYIWSKSHDMQVTVILIVSSSILGLRKCNISILDSFAWHFNPQVFKSKIDLVHIQYGFRSVLYNHSWCRRRTWQGGVWVEIQGSPHPTAMYTYMCNYLIVLNLCDLASVPVTTAIYM